MIVIVSLREPRRAGADSKGSSCSCIDTSTSRFVVVVEGLMEVVVMLKPVVVVVDKQ